jgi:thiol-disulfide isomerase/thioredoxin
MFSRTTQLVVVLIVVAGAWMLNAPAAGQVQEMVQPTYGAPAPMLSLELLQAPTGATATWDSLKGNAVVLEFWSTWCSGCVAQIPHLNELASQFKDKPVRFISVTDEDKSAVIAFLPKRPISGWVALDSGSVTFKRFGIYGRPYTALVDANGVLRGLTPPTEVNESTIDQLLVGTLQMKQVTRGTPIIGTEPNSPLPLAQVLVRPAMPVADVHMSPGAQRTTGNRWEAWGMDLRGLLFGAYDIPVLRIVLPENLPRTRYDLSLVLPDSSRESRTAMLRQLVTAIFGVSVRRELREMEVYVLRKAASGNLTFQPSEKGRPMRAVVSLAESSLDHVVVDETGLTERYDFVLAFPKDQQELLAAVKALGLQLAPERRSIEVLVVEFTISD